MNRIKQFGLVISFVSLQLGITFMTILGNKEIDDLGLKACFFISIAIMCFFNGYSHGKLISDLNN